jgi:hypothetical protein
MKPSEVPTVWEAEKVRKDRSAQLVFDVWKKGFTEAVMHHGIDAGAEVFVGTTCDHDMPHVQAAGHKLEKWLESEGWHKVEVVFKCGNVYWDEVRSTWKQKLRLAPPTIVNETEYKNVFVRLMRGITPLRAV